MVLANKKILCFGELLLRYSPVMNGGFIHDASMPVFIGGAELNAATALANWGEEVAYYTAMPDHYMTEEIIQYIKSKKIDASRIRLSGERIGAYYLPQGKDLKNNAVIYDRNYSSFSQLKPGEIDWNTVLKDIDWFHFSAISPALNQQVADVCLEAVKAASAKGITVSVDLNYRAKLWQYGKQPAEIMVPMMEYCDVVMGNVWSAEKLAGIALSVNFNAVSGEKLHYLGEAQSSAEKMKRQYPKIKFVANTFRFDEGESGIKYFASLDRYDKQFSSAVYRTAKTVDRIGSGDCFMGGLIYGIINNHSPQDIIEFSAAAAFAKLQQKGDATTSTAEDVKKTIQQNG